MMALPSGFSPFVEFSDEAQQWRWIGKKGRSQMLSECSHIYEERHLFGV